MSDHALGLNHFGETASPRPLIVLEQVQQSRDRSKDQTNDVPIDVYETASYLVVRALVPGAEIDDLAVTVDRDVLRLTGRLCEERANPAEHLTWHRHGIESRQFDESIPLPVPVDLDRALATYGSGVLSVQFPKNDPVGVRRIPIRPHQSPAGLS